MTEDERLAKNKRIREQGRLTREKRKSQIYRVYRVKIDISHLNEQQKLHLKMLFVEAKWLYNDALTFMKNHDINNYNMAIQTVHGLDKDRQPIAHYLQYISSQMKQSVIHGIKYSLKSLAALKKHNHHIVGRLRYKSDYLSINLQQYKVTYRFYDESHIGLQGIKGRITIKGAKQFWDIPGIEFANAKLLNLPDGSYLAIKTYQTKWCEQKKYKPEIGGIDMGIKTTITTSEGRKMKVLIGESERIKKLQRIIARRKKGSNNRYKTRKLLRVEYQKLDNKKRDAAIKIVHELLEHERVYMQDENLSGWHKGLSGRRVQHSILGLVKSKLVHVYECSCGYRADRDIHAARNMIMLAKTNTCGTQGIDAYGQRQLIVVRNAGEDVRRLQPIRVERNLVELGSTCFYKRG